MAQETILVVDDEENIRQLARLYLERDGFKVITAVDGLSALDIIRQNEPSLLLLDLMLPGMDGWELCRRIRQNSNLPIIMLTARTDDMDKIIGLEMGADDYVTKPFNPRELVARVRALLRRTAVHSGPKADQVRQIGNVLIEPTAREVTIDGRRVPLRAKEFDLLVTLADHVNMVLSRDQLLDLVWGQEFFGQTRTVDVHIGHLRERLADSNLHIETVWGLGYKLTIAP